VEDILSVDVITRNAADQPLGLAEFRVGNGNLADGLASEIFADTTLTLNGALPPANLNRSGPANLNSRISGNSALF